MASFPTLQVFVGFTSASTNNFLFFDDTVLGKFDTGTFASTSVGTAGVWADVSADVRDIQITRGRQRQIEAFAAGTCSIVLDNNAGDYDPDNSASKYWISGATTVLPMRQVAIRARWNNVSYDLFTGFIDDIRPNYAQGQYSDAWTTVIATDAMKVLQNIKINNVVRGAEGAFTRFTAILDSAGWSSTLRVSNSTGPSQQLQATTLANSAAQELQNTLDSEYGRWYIDPAGRVVYENRSSRNATQTTSTTWSDTNAGSNLVYSQISRVADDQLIRNTVTVQNVGGIAQTVSDTPSQTTYQQRTFSLTNLLLRTNLDANQLANILVYLGKGLNGCRFESVTFEPLGDPTHLWPEVLGRAISDRVNVTVTPPNVAPITVGAFVEGVKHTISTAPQHWVTEFHASRANPTPFLQFDDATYGITFATNSTSPANALNTYGF